MADWIFDGVNKIIKEPNIGSGNVDWDAERDIYSAWKRWTIDNSQFLKAFLVEGGTPIGSTGIFTGKTLILTNGWKLMSGDWAHISFVSGNLFSDDGVDVVPNPNFSASLKTFGTSNAQGIQSNGIDNDVINQIKEEIMLDNRKFWQGDESKTPTKYIRTDKDTGEVLVEKNYSNDGNGNESLTQ